MFFLALVFPDFVFEVFCEQACRFSSPFSTWVLTEFTGVCAKFTGSGPTPKTYAVRFRVWEFSSLLQGSGFERGVHRSFCASCHEHLDEFEVLAP